jgi:hypothetical protein
MTRLSGAKLKAYSDSLQPVITIYLGCSYLHVGWDKAEHYRTKLSLQ